MAAAETRTPALHLFRHLLRATSYLPDDFAQLYVRNYIVRKFREARRLSENTSKQLKNGRKCLKTLQRATNGDTSSLNRVLYKAYGRSGRRRRQLLDKLLQADAKCTPEKGTLAESLATESISKDGHWEISRRPVLTLFLKSQVANHPLESDRTQIRIFESEIPKNVFERPIALNRQRNIGKKIWASTLNKILPPLPEMEWNRLRDLATGVIPFEGPPQRRVPAVPPGEKTTLLHSASFLKQSVRATARGEKEARLREMDRHNITARFMRRLWAGVWNQCPLMTYDGETQEWTIIWGGNRSAASQGLIGSAGKKDLELFDGMSDFENSPLRPQRQPNTERIDTDEQM